jgi:hypothetical protein
VLSRGYGPPWIQASNDDVMEIEAAVGVDQNLPATMVTHIEYDVEMRICVWSWSW